MFIAQLGAAVGMLIVLATCLLSGSAPQEAAGAAIGLSFAVIPYCYARISQLKTASRDIEAATTRVVDRLDRIETLLETRNRMDRPKSDDIRI